LDKFVEEKYKNEKKKLIKNITTKEEGTPRFGKDYKFNFLFNTPNE
jgi:hypothetical protein